MTYQKTEDPGPDAYLAFTREPDDSSDSDQSGESLPPAKKARGDHIGRESKSTLDRKIGQSVFDFKAEDRQDHYLLL